MFCPEFRKGNLAVPNAPKWYETHQNMSLGSNGVDRVCSSRKTPTRLRGPNFCTSSEHLAPSSIWQLHNPKCTKMVRNAPKHEFRVQWGGSGAFVVKNSDATSFCSEIGNQMVPNAPKWYKTHQNMSLGSNGVDRLRSLQNDSMRLRSTNFCTSSERFAPSFVRKLHGPKCMQTV